MAKPNSGGTPGSAEAVTSDENPHKLTEERGPPDPHFPLSAYGEIGLGGAPGSIEAVSSDKNPHKLTEKNGAPDPHFPLSAYGETDPQATPSRGGIVSFGEQIPEG